MGTITEMIRLTQGEILKILVERDARSAEEVADAMGFHRTYLSKLYKLDKLPAKALRKAVRALGVSEGAFQISATAATIGDELEAEKRRLELDNERLRQENLQLKAEAYDLIRKNHPGVIKDPEGPIKAAFER